MEFPFLGHYRALLYELSRTVVMVLMQITVESMLQAMRRRRTKPPTPRPALRRGRRYTPG